MNSNTTYQKIASHEAQKGSFDTCLLLYSGGLDTSVMLKWIQEQYKCAVITLTVDIGQTADNLEAIKEKALMLGAKDAIVYDAKDEFADFLLTRAIKSNADYQGGYALGCPLGRVMISHVAIKIAHQYNCQVIAHGATGKGNDQVRFEGHLTTLDPAIKIIAPVREWSMGRDEEIDYAHKHGIPISQTKEMPYSYDENMWANTGEGGEIEDPSLIPSLQNILKWCSLIENTPSDPVLLDITFEKGMPVALNGEYKKLSAIVMELNKTGGAHGVGVFHLIEDRLVGLKVRGVYENPAASILIGAHQKLEQLVSTREENELKSFLDTKWAYLTYAAKWFEPVMEHIHAYVDDHNAKVTGKVTVKLFKGALTVVALESPFSLFNHNLATFNKNAAFNQNASAGFIEIYNLPSKTAHHVKQHNALKKGVETL
ncbi:MAG: Argininosuccinate synthase [Candidatus Magasanikbacteria bacterium GW2011_GWA2_45_39]|uniref:Argininosuccinate synthase n=1 Tax=Candidatus Magasanikbacteria bacterium GW2011_GWA2_45_39 TaxID=1619041 RepID=A0A0G1MH47_9BACT|nr:MAG: Argininosuccinate synthase [Candidatus Magasanikbacteria bacterium GW2011_GWA2_45_39]HBW74233.1 argininosuccinate synthase [Candidatus Magasanikbacteria bacterium]